MARPLTSPETATIEIGADEALIDWAELEHIELVVLKRMKEYAVGAHPSVFHAEGFDFVGLRDWQAGDRPAHIDWAQSTLTNFSPMVTREFEQPSAASMMIVADTSPSTRCGINGVPIAKVIARAVATLSLAAAFFQDQVGLITFNGRGRRIPVRARVGKGHAIHCVESYQAEVLSPPAPLPEHASAPITGMLRRRSLVPVVSDFLFDDPPLMLDELAQLDAVHDVFLVMVDSAFAYDVPPLSAGWVETYDVESRETRVLSTGQLRRLGQEVRRWQDGTEHTARNAGLDVVRLRPGQEHGALTDFLGRRRMRKR